MTNTTNPFKYLGKSFFYTLETTEGFLPETNIGKTTYVIHSDESFYDSRLQFHLRNVIEGTSDSSPLRAVGLPATRTTIRIGKDYKGPLELPKGTEVVEVFDLKKDGNQVILFCHSYRKYPNQVMQTLPFANEMRNADRKVEVKDIIPKHKVITERERIDWEEERSNPERCNCF